MPRNTREWAHRKLDAASNNMDWSIRHCQDIIEKYKIKHTEITEPLELAQAMLIECQKLLLNVKKSF